MEPIVFGFYALLVVGSLCGLRAAVSIGVLTDRLAMLERRLALVEPRPAGAGSKPVLVPAVATAATAVEAPLLAAEAAADAPAMAATVNAAATPAKSREADWWHGFELRAGTRWVTWLGAGALVIAAALFVKLAIDRGWLGPAARLVLSGAAGVGLLFAGRRAHRAEMRPLAQGLFGAGLGVLYVATYVAYASYGLVARELVFVAMIGVTVTGCVIAIRHDAQPVAVLALLGGLLTPVAVSSGDGELHVLFVYLIVLDLGALAIALLRSWNALELLALVGTWVLFGGALSHAAAIDRTAALAWLAAFHALFVAMPFAFHLYRRRAAGPGRFTLSFANVAGAAACATAILHGRRPELGAALLAMAALHGALEVIARRTARGDFGFVALAAGLATLSVPLILRGHGITLAWSIDASLLLALGFHDRRHGLRLAALGVLGLAVLHGAVAGWPHHGARPFANGAFAGALLAPLGAWLFAGVHAVLRHRGDARDRWHGIAAALVGSAVALALVHGELARYFAQVGRRDLGDAAAPIVWALGSLLALGAVARREPPPAIRGAIGLAAILAAGLCVVAYRAPAHPDALLALNLRFVGALVTALALAANAAAAARRDPAGGRLAWTAAIAGFGIAIGAEAYLHYSAAEPLAHATRRAHTALSIAWSAYAALLLAIGFARRLRKLRLAGLALLGFVAIKLLLIDLAGAPQAYRMLSFLVAGALMIAVSFAYHRFERRQR
jgi:uncharacterized membrane protein